MLRKRRPYTAGIGTFLAVSLLIANCQPLIGCRGFNGPVPQPLWMSVILLYQIVAGVYQSGQKLSNLKRLPCHFAQQA